MSGDVIINNVLSFIQSSRDSLTRVEILNKAGGFYKADDVTKAKEIIYAVVQKEPPKRRVPNKLTADIQDIQNVFDEANSSQVEIPTYAAFGMNCLPPSSGYEHIKDALDSMSEEISKLKTELTEVKSQKSDHVSQHINKAISELKKQVNNDLKTSLDGLKKEIARLITPRTLSDSNIPVESNLTSTSSTATVSELNDPSSSFSAMLKKARNQTNNRSKSNEAPQTVHAS